MHLLRHLGVMTGDEQVASHQPLPGFVVAHAHCEAFKEFLVQVWYGPTSVPKINLYSSPKTERARSTKYVKGFCGILESFGICQMSKRIPEQTHAALEYGSRISMKSECPESTSMMSKSEVHNLRADQST